MNKTIASLLASAAMALSASATFAREEITVAYFLEWPLPMLAAKADGTYEEELCSNCNWRAF